MSDNMIIPEISVEELAQRLATETEEALQLIDVREPEEVAIAKIEGFKVFSLSQFSEWSSNLKTVLNPEVETLVMCHHGMRSAQMCQWLLNNGFTNVKNIQGGIDAYSVMVDPAIKRY